MDNEREQQHRRLTNKHKSHGAEKAWKRHHGSYMKGVRKRERDKIKSIYADRNKDENMDNLSIKEINKLFESEVIKDNVFKNDLGISFNNIAGGVVVDINPKDANVSISTTLDGTGEGSYKLVNAQGEQDYINLYESIKEELTNICNRFDEEISQLLSKYGLKSTK